MLKTQFTFSHLFQRKDNAKSAEPIVGRRQRWPSNHRSISEHKSKSVGQEWSALSAADQREPTERNGRPAKFERVRRAGGPAEEGEERDTVHRKSKKTLAKHTANDNRAICPQFVVGVRAAFRNLPSFPKK